MFNLFNTLAINQVKLEPPLKNQLPIPNIIKPMEKSTTLKDIYKKLGQWQQPMDEMSTAWSKKQLQMHSKQSYYSSYTGLPIHQTMLKDSTRTKVYERAILNNCHLFKDKVVLDVGAGTLILSMMAGEAFPYLVRAGARKVYAVEEAGISKHASKVIAANHMEGKIVVVERVLEEVEPPEKVDIIVSEWMGYFLLFEEVINTIIAARNVWLKPDGLMFPDKATIYLALSDCQEFHDSKLKYWDNVYGFNMSDLCGEYRNQVFIEHMPKESIVTDPIVIAELDLMTLPQFSTERYILKEFNEKLKKSTKFSSIIGWFSVGFPGGEVLRTGPYDEQTHWKQCVMLLPEPLQGQAGDDLIGAIQIRKNKRFHRKLTIQILLKWNGTVSTHIYFLI